MIILDIIKLNTDIQHVTLDTLNLS